MSAIITVIIPVYNVEKYLRPCLDSILGQTYKDLEIVLVNDGSLDSSPQICDEYAATDKRIRVIHKRNGGLSSARNAGIDIAQGQYITFVDSDDYIDKDMISYLYNNLIKSKGDIATCGRQYVYNNYTRKTKEVSDQVLVLETDDALNDVLYNEHSTLHAWGKLFKTSLFNSIRFPEGKVYEDAGTTYKLISKSKRVCLGTSKKYNYLERRDSITGSRFSRRTLDLLDFGQEILSYIRKYHPDAIHAAESYLFALAVRMLYLVLSSKQYKTYVDEMNDCKAIVLGQCRSVSTDKRVNKRLRVYAYAARINIKALLIMLVAQNYVKKLGSDRRSDTATPC